MSQNQPKRTLRAFSVLRHPNHFLLAGVNNRNVIITQRFHATLIKQIEIFFRHTDCIFQPLVLLCILREPLGCLVGISPSGRNPLWGGGGGGIRDIGLFFHCASYIEILSTFQVKRVLKFSRKTIAHLLKFRTKAPQIIRVPARVCDVEGGVVCSKNRTWNRVDSALAVSYPDYGL